MLHHPCILGGPQQREQNQKSKHTPGVTMTPLGAPSIPKYGSLVRPDAQIATAIERGGRIRIGPLVGKDGARWLYNPCRLGDPHRLRAGGRIRKEPTSGQGGYITPLGAFGARWLLGPIPLTTNCRPEAPGGGGVVGVLGPAESPPPYPPPPLTSPPYLPPPTPPPYLQGRGGRLRAIYAFHLSHLCQETATVVTLLMGSTAWSRGPSVLHCSP